MADLGPGKGIKGVGPGRVIAPPVDPDGVATSGRDRGPGRVGVVRQAGPSVGRRFVGAPADDQVPSRPPRVVGDLGVGAAVIMRRHNVGKAPVVDPSIKAPAGAVARAAALARPVAP